MSQRGLRAWAIALFAAAHAGGCGVGDAGSTEAVLDIDPLEGAGDRLLQASDGHAQALSRSRAACEEAGAEEPVGYAEFVDDEFVEGRSSIRVRTRLMRDVAPGSVLDIDVSVTTELAQVHHRLRVPVDAPAREQILSIPFAGLGLSRLIERVGTLAIAVHLQDGSIRSTLHTDDGLNAGGFHLKYHVDERGLAHAYLPELRARRYERVWRDAIARRLELHAVHAFTGIDDEHAIDPPEIGAGAGAGTTRRQALGTSGEPSALVPKAPPNVTFCPKMNVEYVDAGLGEDYWTGTALTARPMYGTQYKIYDDGALLMDSYLDETEGCVDIYLPTGDTYEIELWAKAKIWGNYYTVQTSSGLTRVKTYSLTPTSSLQTYAPNLTDGGAQERWNIYEALIRSGRKHGVSSNRTYVFKYDADYTALWNGSFGEIGPTQSERKFIIAHEYGHGLQDTINGDTFSDDYEVGEDDNDNGLCDVNPIPDDDCRSHTGTGALDCDDSGSHKLWSIEHQSAAANEGWGHFIAADVWNDHDEDNCSFSYWRAKGLSGYNTLQVDCEMSDAEFPTRYMEQRCEDNSAYFSTKGVEVDWLRVFWDVHTNSASDPSVSTMLNWIDDPDVNDTNVYEELDGRANAVGGTINTIWDAVKADNGVDH